MRTTIAVICCAASLALSACGQSPEEVLEDAFGGYTQPERVAPPPESLLWAFSTDTPGDLVTVSPSVGDGVVHAASYEGFVYALDMETGELIWSFGTASDSSPSPVVASGVVHVSGLALDAVTGELLWSTDGASGGVFAPDMSGSTFFMLKGDIWDDLGDIWDDLVVTAVDGPSGRELWTATIPSSGPSLFPLTASGDQIYVSDDAQVHALDAATGELVWSHHDSSSLDGPVARPAASEGSVFLMSYDTAYALDTANGELLWSRKIGDIAHIHSNPPTIAGDAMYLLTKDLRTGDSTSTLHSLDTATGNVLWSSELPLASPPAVVADGTVFLSDISGVIHALDAATGHRVWASEPQLGARLLAVDGLLFSNFFGYLYILDAATGEQIWSIDATHVGGGNRTYAVSEGTIFVGYQDANTSGVRAFKLPIRGQ